MAAVSVSDALRIVLDHTPRLPAEEVLLTDALGRVLAEDVRADADMPPFDRAAMDGYAVRAAEVAGAPVVLPVAVKTLEQMGPLHGYGIARRIEQVGAQAVIVCRETIYLCLVRLLQKRWISGKWGTCENNRKAKFYAITKAGRAPSSKPRPRTGNASPASSAACCGRRRSADACAPCSMRSLPGSSTSFVLPPARPISSRSSKPISRWRKRTRFAAA